MVHITLDGYTGAAERRPRRDARSLHTGTTLFRSVPLSLSLDFLPVPFPPLPPPCYVTLFIPPSAAIGSLFTLLLCPSPFRFTLSLEPYLFPSRFFLPVSTTWLLASASSISFIDIGRPPSSSPPFDRSLSSSFRSPSLSVFRPVVVPFRFRPEHTGSYLLSRSTSYTPPCASLVSTNVAYPASTLATVLLVLLLCTRSHRPLSLLLLSLSSLLFGCSFLSLPPSLLSPRTAAPATP